MNVFDNDEPFKCRKCKNIFCCVTCRENHEMKHHASILKQEIQRSCTICEGKLLLVRTDLSEKLLKHIAERHLPLHCAKCRKLYEKHADLKEFTKCFPTSIVNDSVGKEEEQNCISKEAEKEDQVLTTDLQILMEPTVVMKSVAQTQTSPILVSKVNNVAAMALPSQALLPDANFKCQHLYRDRFTDSASSIKNISSIDNSTVPICLAADITKTQGKLVRSTSTPLNTELLPSKPNVENFNIFDNGQVSSIHNSDSEYNISPAVKAVPAPVTSRIIGGGNRGITSTPAKSIYGCRKIGPKIVVSLTPLRQVMSRSIQKAIAASNQTHTSPLDLRLSPALRRIHGETFSSRKILTRDPISKEGDDNVSQENMVTPKLSGKEFLLSSTKLTTEAIVITRTECTKHFESTGTSSVYKSCHSVEIITSTEENCKIRDSSTRSNNSVEDNAEDVIAEKKERFGQQELSKLGSALHPVAYPLAPTPITSIPGAGLNKKLIKFDTPNLKTETNSDIFYTPKASPEKNQLPRRAQVQQQATVKNGTRECSRCARFSYMEDLSEDDVFLPEMKSTNHSNDRGKDDNNRSVGGLWSLMTAVMRLPSFTRSDDNTGPRSLIKRCASIAGSLVRSKSLAEEDQMQGLKRKRTYSADNQTAAQFNFRDSKRFRIQGRKPIERMRKNKQSVI